MPKILIIDDEPLTVNLLETFLTTKGFEVITAQTGHDGMTLAQVDTPDAVILDMMLPDLSGDNICEFLRKTPATARLPILMLSALSTKGAQDKAKAAGADVYLSKSIQLPELLNQLQRLLPTP